MAVGEIDRRCWLGLFFAVKAWSYGLDRFLLLYGDNGVVVPAEVHDRRGGLTADRVSFLPVASPSATGHWEMKMTNTRGR